MIRHNKREKETKGLWTTGVGACMVLQDVEVTKKKK